MDERLCGYRYYCPPGGGTALVLGRGIKPDGLSCCAGARVMREAELAAGADPEGAARFAFLLSDRSTDKSLKARLGGYGLEFEGSYTVFPGFDNPRWFFPAGGKYVEECGNIVKPVKPRSVVAWRLMRMLNRAGVSRLVFPARLVLARKKGAPTPGRGLLGGFIADRLGRDDLEFILYTGAHGYYQKFTAQVMAPDGAAVAYAKVARTEQAKKRLQAEAATLGLVGGRGFSTFSVPEVLGFGRLPGGTEDVMLLSAPQPGCTGFEKELTARHVDALVEVFARTRNGPVDGGAVVAGMEARLRDQCSPEGGGAAGYEGLLKRCTHTLGGVLSGRGVELALSHGDFTPWNVLEGRAGLFVFDWENAGERTPMWDLYNFILYREVLAGTAGPEEVAGRLRPGGPYSGMMSRYRQGLEGRGFYDEDAFMAKHLFDIIVYYLDCKNRQKADGVALEPDAERLMKTAVHALGQTLGRLRTSERTGP